MWRRIFAIVVKELRQLSRDRMTFGMIVMIPLVQLMLFGYAINIDARHLPAGLVNLSDSAYSRALVKAVEATQVVDFKQRYLSAAEAEAAITRGEVKAVLYLPADLDERLVRHPSFVGQQYLAQSYIAQPAGQWLVDGSDTVVASTIRSLRQMPLDEVAGRALKTAMPSFEVVQYFNPEQRSVVNIVPGLLGVILTMTMVMFTSAAIVREREQGNMEFLITTPVRPLELMLGKIVPYVMVGFVQVTIILSAGHLLFDVPIRGGLDSIALAAMLFICASLTLGLVISTIAKTQLQSMQMTVFILLPSILLSGFMFPYEAMPIAAQWIAEALPATHFMRMSRAIVLRDAQVVDLQFDALWMIGFTCIGLFIASMRFSKRLD
ncbi:ABC transporter permease [Shewanella sp. SW36]|uniref:ABC transporter permease n=1 Tax=unclassified Shewanella TaxID=196818 RepID=UPI0021D962F7|nr:MULTISPECIES: ABC transporter permease [unclassified Shewanella]MCU7977376.1 ABC transporter permease [Shewanella sp. SW36]MCU7992633.1 ABC transporter permease [Shewanella sp. SW1]MCU8016974.1 ABC transporter permease [Shewanella sp. SM72]MCU8053815.1 ABC transporter permease [Shewanella sp. SM43]